MKFKNKPKKYLKAAAPISQSMAALDLETNVNWRRDMSIDEENGAFLKKYFLKNELIYVSAILYRFLKFKT